MTSWPVFCFLTAHDLFSELLFFQVMQEMQKSRKQEKWQHKVILFVFIGG